MRAQLHLRPFGVGAFYPIETVTISGTPKEYVRTGASGGEVRSYFCPDCGSTVYWQADNLPAMIGVAVGAIADPDFTASIRSVFEQSKHGWVEMSGAEHFQQGSAAKPST
ncbi:aldehyde-activating protein [Bradyrhizobium sp. LVM 105]|nr:aldehyde-activating protein [Bradyrhizobium sp. LVM 105]